LTTAGLEDVGASTPRPVTGIALHHLTSTLVFPILGLLQFQYCHSLGPRVIRTFVLLRKISSVLLPLGLNRTDYLDDLGIDGRIRLQCMSMKLNMRI
jgi:hypothetical protein